LRDEGIAANAQFRIIEEGNQVWDSDEMKCGSPGRTDERAGGAMMGLT